MYPTDSEVRLSWIATYLVKSREPRFKCYLTYLVNVTLMEKLASHVKDYLNNLFNALREVLIELEKSESVTSIVVFGSATRPADFIPGVSDVDVLALVSRDVHRRHYSFKLLESEVNVSVFRKEELKTLFELGDPLAFMLHRHRIIIKDDGSFSSLTSEKPRITEHTLRVLRNSVFVALGLALETYFLGDYKRSVSHSYHSLRHLARYRIALTEGTEYLPISDEEIKECSSRELQKPFLKIAELRRKKRLGGKEAATAVDEAIKTIAEVLKLKCPTLKLIEEVVKSEVQLIVATEVKDALVIRVKTFENNKWKTLEIKGSSVKELGKIDP